MSQDDRSNIGRIIAILKSFDAHNTPRLSTDIVSDLGMSRSTGFGLLRALVISGWLERFDHGCLRLGEKAKLLAYAALEPVGEKQQSVVFAEPGARSSSNMFEATPDLEWDPALVNIVDAARFRKNGPYSIGFSNASTSNTWRKGMLQSLDYANKIAGSLIRELTVLDACDDPALQLKQINQLAQGNIDLLLISITSVTDTRLSDRLAELARDGLPIVAVDRRPNDRTSLVSFVTASDHRIGRVSALWMSEHLHGQGRVWMLSGLEGASPALRRQKAALTVFSEFAGIQVENVSYTDWTSGSGYSTINRLLAETIDPPDGIWCDSGLQGVGSVKYFVDAGLPIPAHTGGDVNEMYKLCLHNKVPMVALDYPASMGAKSLEVALDVLLGNPVPQRVEVPVQVILPRGHETPSVKADQWAELHVEWGLPADTILSQGPAMRSARSATDVRDRIAV